MQSGHRQRRKQDFEGERISLLTRRNTAVAAVKRLSPWVAETTETPSSFEGGLAAAQRLLSQIKPRAYGENRNHLDGDVTRLSPYISRGVLNTTRVRDEALRHGGCRNVEKFVQQLAWRDYWQGILEHNPDYMWDDAEDYKTGFKASDYSDVLPEDIAAANTGVACIDQFLRQLLDEGWVHNHARLYLAGYICHWRRVRWQAGAQFFLSHLLDADPASNNLSWQWAASTFSQKPYYFNLENVRKFSGPNIDTRDETNGPLAASYEDLYTTLFPNLERRE
jgi:deoxyribodipyrimidine photo-lyase